MRDFTHTVLDGWLSWSTDRAAEADPQLNFIFILPWLMCMGCQVRLYLWALLACMSVWPNAKSQICGKELMLMIIHGGSDFVPQEGLKDVLKPSSIIECVKANRREGKPKESESRFEERTRVCM